MPPMVHTPQELKWVILKRRVVLPNGCWVTGTKSYAFINYRGQRYRLTRLIAHVVYKMPLDSPMDVCHHCDNPACFRPSHLFVGTRSQNIQDALNKGLPFGRYPRIQPQTKARVLALHKTHKYSQRAIANKVGITQTSVWRIIHNAG